MRPRRKPSLWIMIGVTVLCIGVPTVLISQQLRQEALDHALIQAVKWVDAPTVTRLLDEGACADARDTEDPPRTIPQLLEYLGLQLQHKTVSSRSRPTALGVLLSDERWLLFSRIPLPLR